MVVLLLTVILSAFTMTNTQDKSIHHYKIQALNSDEMIDFSEFAGKKILVVNVASKCGFTDQYEGLEQLYRENKDKLVIVGFPCNQFLSQEPGSEDEIAQFCQQNYGVSFPLTTKIKVKGKDQHEIYKFLTNKELNGKDDYKISWNFNKFLLDEKGRLIAYFPTKTVPLSAEILNAIMP